MSSIASNALKWLSYGHYGYLQEDMQHLINAKSYGNASGPYRPESDTTQFDGQIILILISRGRRKTGNIRTYRANVTQLSPGCHFPV